MNPKKETQKVYKAPAIVFEGTITTRAGTLPGTGNGGNSLDVTGTD